MATVAAVISYCAVMPLLFRTFGPGVESIAIGVVVLAAAGFGLRGGLFVAVGLVSVHIASYGWFVDQTFGQAFSSASLPANLVLPLVGAVVGRLHDLQIRINEEISRAARTREELQQASVLANAANVAKGDFLARMSHEIRTPMHGVIGMSQLLLESKLSRHQREYTEMIQSSANALLLIVNDILDFSKVEAGRLNLDPVDFGLPGVLSEVVDLMRVQARSKDLSLVLLSPPDLPERVFADPGRLRQILINLLGNALKFTEEGEILLEISVRDVTDSGARVHFAVRDTGIGMAPAHAAGIFEPFRQADDSSTRQHGGTGLGLTICKELVELMGGEIGVESSPGQGSTFWFTIDLPHAKTAASLDLPTGPLQVSSSDMLDGMRAVLASEGDVADETLALRLRSLGLRVQRYTSVDEVLRVMRTDASGPDPVRLCILDAREVDQPALDLARMLGTDPSLTDIVPILVALEGAHVSSREVEAAGYAAFLEQPIDQALLAEGLRAALGLGASARTTRKRTFMVTRHTVVARQQQERPRVLLAEDNQINQVIAVKLLERQGLRVDVVGDGRQAVSASADRRYAAIFMDCLMPDVDGFEATRQIRAREEAAGEPPVPIIAMTASAMAGDRDRSVAAGMDDFLAKPVERGSLERALGKWLPSRRLMERRIRQTGPRRLDLPVDVVVLGNLKRAGGPEVVRVAIDLFLEAGNESLHDIHEAVATGDPTQIRAVVHKFKGSCGSVGARAMASICGRMEQASGAGPLVLEGELEALKAEFRRVEQALRGYRASGSGAFEPVDVSS
ncbi:MAG: response regulator [Myxococcales bacterium]|nr:response regulator [Myxococcales bacterium]